MKKRFIILSLILSFNASADDLPSCGTNCTYTIEDGVLTISPIDSSQPASVKSYDRYGYSTTTDYAPWRFENVTSIIIEKGVTDIGNHAFEDILSLKTLELPEGLKTIGHEAFHSTSIEKVNLPSTLTSINTYAFAIKKLKEINELPEGLNTIGAQAFLNTQIKNVVVPSSVTMISPSAFGFNGSGYNNSLIENLYCAEAIADQCEAAVQWKKDLGQTVHVTTYKKNADGTIFYGGHWYQNANDILTPNNHIKKRIYTIDEAEMVLKSIGKDHVKFRIRYK